MTVNPLKRCSDPSPGADLSQQASPAPDRATGAEGISDLGELCTVTAGFKAASENG